MTRVVVQEWLDRLPADEPRAVRSRRDLDRLNRLLGHARQIAASLKTGLNPRCPKPRIVDLGCGDGRLSACWLSALARRWPAGELILVDRLPAVEEAALERIRSLGWQPVTVRAELMGWLEETVSQADAVVANLVLHHFGAEPLKRMFGLCAGRTALFVASEPRRTAWALALSRAVGLLGCGEVTRHDAAASVQAGFRGAELTDLWGDRPGWRLDEWESGWCSHRFVARATA
jgi:SAM-dependent methyltransferase